MEKKERDREMKKRVKDRDRERPGKEGGIMR